MREMRRKRETRWTAGYTEGGTPLSYEEELFHVKNWLRGGQWVESWRWTGRTRSREVTA